MSRKEKVTKVIDGDTFKTASRKNSVRLVDIDGCPCSAKAEVALRKMIEGEEVRINTVSHDKYGRAVADVYLGRESVNKKMEKKLR